MTTLLYQTEPYLAEFAARVLERVDGGVRLDRMAFFPGAGGQPADAGAVTGGAGTAEVAGFQRDDHGIAVLLDGPLPGEGEQVRCVLDWDRRYALMRTHTSLHLLAGVVGRDYGGVILSRSMQPLRGRVDFELAVSDETVSGESFAGRLEEALRREIAAARPVSVSFLSPDEFLGRPDLIRTKTNQVPAGLDRIRVVEIAGLDRQADGGTHVASTREVVALRVAANQSRGAGKRRLRIELDQVAPPRPRADTLIR
ncbi:alanyl-tRNA editing protein [Amycolatopsis sp. NPDC054798]